MLNKPSGNCAVRSSVQPEKALSPMVVRLAGHVISFKALHFRKASWEMLVTAFPNTTSSSDSSSRNASLGITFTESDRVTFSKPPQSLNAYSPIVNSSSDPFANVTSSNRVQDSKALTPISITEPGIVSRSYKPALLNASSLISERPSFISTLSRREQPSNALLFTVLRLPGNFTYSIF